jgi:signal transduction histidine kinase
MSARAEVMAELAERLHDLCQPLTALQCRLEIAGMQGEAIGTARDCMGECERMNRLVKSMRELVRRAQNLEEEIA